MLKTIIIIILFIIVIAGIAFAFSLFFTPQQSLRYDECVLLKQKQIDVIGCFGCFNNICKDATIDWEYYEDVSGGYTCEGTTEGCKLK